MPTRIASAAQETYDFVARTEKYTGEFKVDVIDHYPQWRYQALKGEELGIVSRARIKTSVKRGVYKPSVQQDKQFLGESDHAQLNVDDAGAIVYPDDLIGWEPSSHKGPDYFYISQDLGNSVHVSVGVPTYVQFVIEFTNDGKYRFGDAKDILVEVDAGDAFESVITSFKASDDASLQKWIGVAIFGKIKDLPSLKGKKLRVSMHLGFGVLETGDWLRMRWHSLWVQYKSILSQTLGFLDMYEEETLEHAIRSVRLRGRSGSRYLSRGSGARKSWGGTSD